MDVIYMGVISVYIYTYIYTYIYIHIYIIQTRYFTFREKNLEILQRRIQNLFIHRRRSFLQKSQRLKVIYFCKKN